MGYSTSIPTIWSTAVVLVIIVVSGVAAAATPPPPAPSPTIGMPGCETRCGNMSVPYPFGMGSSNCYHSPGFNLTCDRRTDPPRLLLGDGTLQVIENIDVEYSSVVRVKPTSHHDIYIDADGNGAFSGGFSAPDSPYSLSGVNELILTGCNVQATLKNTVNNVTISSCSSLCQDGTPDYNISLVSDSSCRSRVINSRTGSAYHVHVSWFGANISDDKRWPTRVLVATKGWFEQNVVSNQQLEKDHPWKDAAMAAAPPVLLSWEVPFRQGANNLSNPTWSTDDSACSEDERRNVCKSNHSTCSRTDVRLCRCDMGYIGNPYFTDGCRDLDECPEISCYGNCTNTDGSFECHCPAGTRGNPTLPGGCISYSNLSASDAPCKRSCGDVAVPFPFGMGPPRCYLPGFNLTCHYGHHEHPRLLLDDLGTLRVIAISIKNTTVHVVRTGVPISITDGDTLWNFKFEVDFMRVIDGDVLPLTGLIEKIPYSLSTRNELILIRCNVQAMLVGGNSWMPESWTYLSGCSSLCSLNGTYAPAEASSGGDMNCYGVGCCQAHISVSRHGMPQSLELNWIDPNSAKKLPIYALVAEEGWFDRPNVSGQLQQDVPIVLDWEVLQQSAGGRLPRPPPSTNICPAGVPNAICKSKNSRCVPGIRGYTCQCVDGYKGNPYTLDGGCTRGPKSFQGTAVLIGLVSGSGLILFVLLGLFISNKLKHRRAQILKNFFFEKNRGKLLQQLVSQRVDISERMIISLEELEKATNNFDKTRELGGGGHGTVYKGILSDLHVVAIKKPKKVVQEEIEEFINEVAILSQINHRNVVKLYGCCLETEVPMLVYEFISNGTLHDHLHVEEEKSLSWDDRQRIAIETAKSIAYLHSTASTPIIHRDIKSVNILLDDTLTAKVADFGASRYVPMDKSGLTTRVQGTIGYMDPMYYYTGRLTEKSDVFGFGVMLVELLTRQKPFLYQSSEGDGLVAHFSTLFAEGNLLQILDPQVMEEGSKEVEKVASLAVACIKLAGADRPTMRQVELGLESIQSSKQLENVIAPKCENVGTTEKHSWIKDTGISKECTRQYSMEQEIEISARYPR